MAVSNTTISLRKSNVPGNVPTTLANGEIAINTADGIIFYKDNLGTIKGISTGSGGANSFSTINVSSTLLIATSNTDILSITGNGAISVVGDALSDTIRINVADATTTQKGVVRLIDSTNSNSLTLSATANSVNSAYSLAQIAYDTAMSRVSSTLTTNYKVEQYIANAGQTIVSTNGYTPEYISVYVNGVLLDTSDYIASDGTNVIFNTALSYGDSVSVGKWFFDSSSYLSAVQVYDQHTANTGQTLFVANTIYTPGFLKVYRNGVLLEDSEFTAIDGANVSLSHAASANDIVTLHYWGATGVGTLPVYQTANLALSVAYQAWDSANQSYSVYYTANTSLSVAQQASDRSNTAILAFGIANNALTIAQQASDNANTALLSYNTANNALIAAQQASNLANNAMQTLQYGKFLSNSVSTSANTANQILDLFSTSTYRSAKYQIQITSGSDYQVSEISLVHNGSDVFMTEYGLVCTNSSLADYTADVSGSNVRLLISPINNINTINFVKTYITL